MKLLALSAEIPRLENLYIYIFLLVWMKLFYNFKVDTFESVYVISPPRDSQLRSNRLKVRNLKQAFVKNIEIVEITRTDNKI